MSHPALHGKVVSSPYDLGDNVVVARTIASGAITQSRLLVYQTNVSQPDQSGPVTISHNLGTVPTWYGAQPLSSGSNSMLQSVQVGLLNASQLSFRGVFSGGSLLASCSGLPYSVWAVGAS